MKLDRKMYFVVKLILVWQIMAVILLLYLAYKGIPIVRGEVEEGKYEYHTMEYAVDMNKRMEDLFK